MSKEKTTGAWGPLGTKKCNACQGVGTIEGAECATCGGFGRVKEERCDRCDLFCNAGIGKTCKHYHGGAVDGDTIKLMDAFALADAINPDHYKQHPSGVEAITITEHFNFCLGNAIKYIWRAGLKSENVIEDLQKARWYIEREIERVKKHG